MRKNRTKLERLKQSKRIKTHTFTSIRRHLVRTGYLSALNKNMEKLFFSKSALNKVRIKLEEIRYATGHGRIGLVKCYEVRETGLVKSDWLNQIS